MGIFEFRTQKVHLLENQRLNHALLKSKEIIISV